MANIKKLILSDPFKFNYNLLIYAFNSLIKIFLRNMKLIIQYYLFFQKDEKPPSEF